MISFFSENISVSERTFVDTLLYKNNPPAFVSLKHFHLLGEVCSLGSGLVISRDGLHWMARVDVGILTEIVCLPSPETCLPSWAPLHEQSYMPQILNIQWLIFAYASNESQPDSVAQTSSWAHFFFIWQPDRFLTLKYHKLNMQCCSRHHSPPQMSIHLHIISLQA